MSEENSSHLKKAPRVQLELPPKAFARLNFIKERTEAPSYNEVMRVALRLYERIHEHQEAGGQLMLKDKDGTLTNYEVFL